MILDGNVKYYYKGTYEYINEAKFKVIIHVTRYI